MGGRARTYLYIKIGIYIYYIMCVYYIARVRARTRTHCRVVLLLLGSWLFNYFMGVILSYCFMPFDNAVPVADVVHMNLHIRIHTVTVSECFLIICHEAHMIVLA